MVFEDLAKMWLRDKADDLRRSANRVESAYSNPGPAAACARVAKAYRRAAVLLDEEAESMEEGRDARENPAHGEEGIVLPCKPATGSEREGRE